MIVYITTFVDVANYAITELDEKIEVQFLHTANFTCLVKGRGTACGGGIAVPCPP